MGFSTRRHVAVQGMELTPGFAAFEQYGTRDIGPWTDVYAMSAVLYYLLIGRAPTSALDRAAGAALVAPNTVVADVSPALSTVVMRGLSLLPEQRPHAASELRRQLENALAETAMAATRGGQTPAGMSLPSMVATPDSHSNSGGRDAPLRFSAGGIIVPNEERGSARLFRRIGDAAARLRRAPSVRPPEVNAEPAPEPPAKAPEPRRAAVPEARREARQRADTAVVDAPPLQTTAYEEPSPTPSLATVVVESATHPLPVPVERAAVPQPQTAVVSVAADILAQLAQAESDSVFEQSRSRRPLVLAGAGVLVGIVAGSLALLNRTGSGVSPVSLRNVPVAVASAEERPASSTSAPVPRENSTASAVVQGSTRADSTPATSHTASETSAREPATRSSGAAAKETSGRGSSSAAPPSRTTTRNGSGLIVPNINVAIPGGSSVLKIVPAEIVTDIKARLTSGQEQAEQGEYAVARRMFRAALLQLDSATARFPDSQSLRALRRDISQADDRSLQACVAENELHRRRGERPGVCQ
jgi:hypothetical protein